ncbi:MAG: hypothetical protein ACE15E_05660 [Acidobacteriota bacterium]
MKQISQVLALFAIGFALLGPALCVAGTDAPVLVLSSQNPAVLVLPTPADGLVRLGADALARYITAVTGVAPKELASAIEGHTPIVFALAAFPYMRPDGYRLEITGQPGREAIRVTAPSTAGLKYGAYRLIREMRQQGREIQVPPLQIEASPWVKTRELFVAEIEWHPTEGEKAHLEELHRAFDWPHWENQRLDTYVDLVDWMGYNSLQLMDLESIAKMAGVDREVLTAKTSSMYRRARSHGMSTAFFLWTQSGLKHGRPDNCPRAPDEMEDIRAHWDYLFANHGNLVDRWILHWADPGGCARNGCTINTTQLLANEFGRRLRSRSLPGVTSYSLWALRWHAGKSGVWDGFQDWRSVVNSGLLDPEIGINLGRYYKAEIAEAIRAQNRRTGVWGWYTNDFETHPALHVHDLILQNEFGQIPHSAGTVLDWYSLEDNNHLLDLPSLYVGAQMLWDRTASAKEALHGFCEALWGPAADSVFEALQAISQVRCGPGEPWVTRDWWPESYMCRLGRGSDDPETDFRVSDEALKKLDAAKIDPGFVPKMPLLVDPQEFLELIRFQLVRVRDFAAVRTAYQQALEPADAGRFGETKAKMSRLPEFSDVLPKGYGAGLELYYDKILRGFAGAWLERSPEGNLALGAKTTAGSCFNGDPRFSPEMAVNGLTCEIREQGWMADRSGAEWLKIDLGSPTTVRSVRVYGRGCRREFWENNVVSPITSVKVYWASSDPDPRNGSVGADEAGYSLLGGFEKWSPGSDPLAFRDVLAASPISSRYIKLVFETPPGQSNPGCGEIEVR